MSVRGRVCLCTRVYTSHWAWRKMGDPRAGQMDRHLLPLPLLLHCTVLLIISRMLYTLPLGPHDFPHTVLHYLSPLPYRPALRDGD
jgi:hypothetical protein